MVSEFYRQKAIQRLLEIEQAKQVKILLAVESGSRAWGFASTDSDYDVRFIYRHDLPWYLDILQRRDVIEYPIVDEMDYSGRDLRKTLYLLNKSNPVLYEWFQSPIRYMANEKFLKAMQEPLKKYFSPKATMYHYLRMAENNYREYLRREMVKTKEYFYVLRPLFACHWIERENSPPPMEFQTVMDSEDLSPEVKNHIESLLIKKIRGVKFSEEPRLDALNDYIEGKIGYFKTIVQDYNPGEKPLPDYLNRFFSQFLQESY